MMRADNSMDEAKGLKPSSGGSRLNPYARGFSLKAWAEWAGVDERDLRAKYPLTAAKEKAREKKGDGR